ncbi:hypothetical protein [Streptomyces violaceorubidus]|uniref:hypothetical protein n=1 Tax=Streptomyces violaceorubidus TaxID=284042 RepID=UPI0004BFAC15|nr:hypothetical protein [Streptomyces violaceorubidus]
MSEEEQPRAERRQEAGQQGGGQQNNAAGRAVQFIAHSGTINVHQATPADPAPAVAAADPKRRRPRRSIVLTSTGAGVAAVALVVGTLAWTGSGPFDRVEETADARGVTAAVESKSPSAPSSPSATATSTPSSTPSSASPSAEPTVEKPAKERAEPAPTSAPTQTRTSPSVDFTEQANTHCGGFRDVLKSSAIKMRACSQVNPDRRTATFGMQVWNTGVAPVTVSTMVKQFRSGARADCPGMPSPGRKIYINPGDSWWSDLGLCGAEDLDLESFQAVAYAVEDPAGTMDPTSSRGVNSISLALNEKGQVLCKYGNNWPPC